MANPSAEHELNATVEHDAGGHGGEHVEPVAFGFVGPGAWVSLAMLVFIGILVWKGVPKLITGGLDAKIAAIREQLDEAKKLRAEAEALRGEYAAKIANAEKDAAAMIEHAKTESEAIVAKAEADAKAVIGRRERMAEDKIAGAERAAVDEVRAKAALAATEAARGLIAAKHDADADRKLVDEAISSL
ncbi:ATP synthase subunit B [Altererythrobacter sp. Root672]|uniref:F0F1 ATP synthase subunit B family protein n=1 Tax=Altererythrobacter sp. Root672 TaxID=1736584 RepID=UPI0006F41E49|nr:ATP synthase subunit B [Altererythrobacter sp. Root672]KRA83094.1 ATP synthase subunit B [Altererythrobacter sp. Root672]